MKFPKRYLPSFKNYSSVLCVVDALDECNETLRWDLIKKLEQLQPKLRLLITSRYFESIAEELKGYERFEIKLIRQISSYTLITRFKEIETCAGW